MDLLKDRIAHILRAKNLTATQFAEMMQIQPSNVSHLLSGRNKPSLDFLIKLKEIFPEYNFDWIIMGKKPITTNEPYTLFKEENPIEVIQTESIDNQNNIPIQTAVKDSVLNSKGLRQIIYVYEDHTFEIFNIRS